ncbi:CBS domain-containing protein [Nocardia gamkensis]|uniref:CBS domain-containing protein n=1 Tax=Nocardia gamkensis TaxID=352869 RepID=UPI0033EA9E5C
MLDVCGGAEIDRRTADNTARRNAAVTPPARDRAYPRGHGFEHRSYEVIPMHARDVLSRPVVTARPETPLSEATALLTAHGFAALPVVDEQGRVVGMLSESDALAAGPGIPNETVEAVMSTPVEVVTPTTDTATIASRMLAGRLRSMPVVEAGLLVGIVSRRDLLRVLLSDDATIDSATAGTGIQRVSVTAPEPAAAPPSAVTMVP